jgi:hypothetical protein
MVTMESVEKQLKKLHFNYHAWGKAEVKELPNILLDGEEIFEAVNGIYDGGFALLVATDVRLLLIDKKPLNYLTVEDLRFDMINELDYSHRLFGARINISAGSKNLKFMSYNQARLRKAIGHVQHCMAEAKKKQSEHQEDQKSHLEQINQQLQAYLLAQHQQQENLKRQIKDGANGVKDEAQPIKPSPELADYLYAQSLLAQYQALTGKDFPNQTAVNPLPPEIAAQMQTPAIPTPPLAVTPPPPPMPKSENPSSQMAELYEEGMKEIFGDHGQPQTHNDTTPTPASTSSQAATQPALPQPQALPAATETNPARLPHIPNPLEINPLRIAYSKLPMALRNRKFGRPSFHAHSQAETDADTAIGTQPHVATAQ